MSDNVGYTPGSGALIASRQVTYSGEIAKAQAVGLVTFEGPDDGKTVKDVTPANPLPTTTGPLEWFMRQIRDLLMSPRAYDSALNRLRQTAIIESGTVTTVSTVTTVTDITRLNSFGALPAEAMARHQNLVAWQSVSRGRII
jgi:hypothetical protein